LSIVQIARDRALANRCGGHDQQQSCFAVCSKRAASEARRHGHASQAGDGPAGLLEFSTMNPVPKQRMTVDEYLAWADGRPGRYELYAGVVYAMSPERAGHAAVKYAVQTALLSGIRRAGLTSYMLPDGMTVRVDQDTAHEPDEAIEAPNPVIVVEVLAPSPRHIDASAKLAGYFRVASVRHYLIVDPDKRLIVHHARGEGDVIMTRIVRDGTLRLDPPGIELAAAEIFQA
jgi:Uma2 family endonuclease